MARYRVALIYPSTETSAALFYLQNSVGRVPYAGTGTPWTVESTTPVVVGMNDTTGDRFGMAAPVDEPLIAPSSDWQAGVVQTMGYREQTTVIPVQIYGSTLGNALVALEELRAFLGRAAVGRPTLLSVTPPGGSVDTVFEVLHGTVQELARSYNEEAASAMIRAQVTIRHAIGSTAEQAATPNATPFATTVTNGDVVAVSIARGDLRHWPGQPMALTLKNSAGLSGAGVKTLYAATTTLQTVSSGLAISLVTSGTGANVGSASVQTISEAARLGRQFSHRVVMHATTTSANLEVRAIIRSTSSSGAILHVTPWVAPGALTGAFIDLGAFVLPPYLSEGTRTMTAYAIQAQARSTNGSPTTGTLTTIRSLRYLTWCKVTTESLSATTGLSLANLTPVYTSTASGALGVAARPSTDLAIQRGAAASIFDIYGEAIGIPTIQGHLPRANALAPRLYLAWTSNGEFDPADTAAIYATYLPLYTTLRGA